MGAMAITTTSGAVTVLTMTGDVDGSNYYQMVEAVERALRAGSKQLIMDLSGVPFMSSAGLWAMQMIIVQVTSARGKLAVCGPVDAVRRLMDMSGFSHALDIYPDLAAARPALRIVPRDGDMVFPALQGGQSHVAACLASRVTS
jgi:anti-sigma B factor antagonist